MTPAPVKPRRTRDSLPSSAGIVVGVAVSATIGLADVAYVLSVAGGAVGGRLLAVLPIYFIAAFVAAGFAFWLFRAAVGVFVPLDLRGLGVAAGLTFLAAGLLHYAESSGVQRVLQEQVDMPAARYGSCPPGQACLPAPESGDLPEADADRRRTLAERGLLNAELFSRLMRDADPLVRATLARRGDLPPELLERLVGDRHPDVRVAVAESPRLSDEAFNRLAFDREERVRLTVAGNRNAPPTALEALAASRSAEIRLRVATHPRASEPVLQRLLDAGGDPAERLARRRLRGEG